MGGEGRLREREEHGLGSRKERKSEKKREGGRGRKNGMCGVG